MQALGRGAVPYQRARELVAAAVPQHVEAWAKTIGLQSTDARFAQFREDVTEALHACMRAHIATPGRWRLSTMRQTFLDLADDYAAIAKVLRHWESGGTLAPVYFDPRFKDLPPLMDPTVLRSVLAPYGRAADFKRLAKAARGYAELCVRDKGTRPRSLAFDTLCVGLVDAFERATKRKATSSGDYFRLVAAVWAVTGEVARGVTKQPPPPSGPLTPSAMRKRLLRLLKRRRRDPWAGDKSSDS
jgi:hypothetical protein